MIKDSIGKWFNDGADTTVNFVIPDTMNIEWSEDVVAAVEPEIVNENLLYVHIENPEGKVQEYWVTELTNGNGGMYDVFAYKGCKLRAYYRRRITTYLIE